MPITLPCIKGGILMINSIINSNNDMYENHNVKYLMTSGVSTECLKSEISGVRITNRSNVDLVQGGEAKLSGSKTSLF